MDPRNRSFGAGLLALGAGLALVAVLGPVGLGVAEYRFGESMLNQARGLDAFALAVVAPVAAAAGWLALRGHRAAPVLAMAPAGFAAYMLVQYVIGPEYLQRPGNGEAFFPLFAALFALSGWLLLAAWGRVRDLPLPVTERQARARGRTLLGLAAFLVGAMYLANGFTSALDDFPRFVADRAATSEYDEHPTAYWIVAWLDLAVVLPVTVATGLGLLRRRAWAVPASYGVLGWFALVPGSVASMAITMVIRDDPAGSVGRAVVLTVAAAVFAALAVRLHLLLLRPRQAGIMPVIVAVWPTPPRPSTAPTRSATGWSRRRPTSSPRRATTARGSRRSRPARG